MEVTRQNFEQVLPEIAEKISKATFLAIDAEYTGIYSVEGKSSKSLFDTADQRYQKVRENAGTFTSCQYGLAIFEKDREKNIYKIEAYNFFVFPVAFDAYAKRDVLTCQVSCINFLARHKFDFNKFFREGVPFLNKDKVEGLRSFLRANRHFMNTCEFLDPHYFPEKIVNLTDENIEDIISHLAGFSKVIDLINDSQKPVVGHNAYTDLLLTYQLFYDNLPKSYDAFKQSMLADVFPTIYDTKYLAREVQKIRRTYREEDSLLVDTNLFALYTNTYSEFELNMPLVDLQSSTMHYNNVLQEGRGKNLESIPSAECHSAGFDAVVTGCVFLNLCYMASRPKPEPVHRKGLPPTFSELLGRTEEYKNKINIARAIIPYVNLGGPDPESHRPNWIIAKSLDGRFIDAGLMKLELVKYGDIEVDPINNKEVIVACGSGYCFKRVWGDLKQRGLHLTQRNAVQSGILSWLGGLNLGIKLIIGVGFSGALAVVISLVKQKHAI